MRPELKKIIAELDELEAGLAASAASSEKSSPKNKIDEFFRLLLLGENTYIANYLAQLKEGDDWLLFNDVTTALEAGGFFDLFPRKKWVINMVKGSWDKAMREAREEMEKDSKQRK